MRNTIYVLAILFSGFALADERPVRPKPTIDVELVSETPGEFFAKRRENTECTAGLAKVEAEYKAARLALKKVIAEKAPAATIDKTEATMGVARSRLIDWASKCGDCVSRPIAHARPLIDGAEEMWYVADGSCHLSNVDPEIRKKIYERAHERLMDSSLYPRHVGGFPSILNFDGIDPATGGFLPAGKIVGEDFLSFIAVKGPFMGIGSLSFSYVAKNKIKQVAAGASRKLSIEFDITSPPPGFVPPAKINEITASGRKKFTINTTLPRGWGMWYVTEEGYFRYATAADFGQDIAIADKFAQDTLLEALFSLVENSMDGLL